ncbi:MAG: VacB/RNase II family 3'-5' exoribonuclease [Desulfovibrionaceae bacterium]|nr:VacB/RNase II family 3'-5' exoribonuclease [Desulfovibrionaceae bacterium]
MKKNFRSTCRSSRKRHRKTDHQKAFTRRRFSNALQLHTSEARNMPRIITARLTKKRTPEGLFLCACTDPRFHSLLLMTDFSKFSGIPEPGVTLLLKPMEQVSATCWKAAAVSIIGREEYVSVQETLVKGSKDIPRIFPPEVREESAKIPEFFHASNLKQPAADPEDISIRSSLTRQDLRVLPFVTIDGEDARDFDDAIYVRRLSASDAVFELWVSIADVSQYVRPGSAIDREALKRGNSYYFPASVETMLPERLCNDLCSLRPDEDRLTLTARLGFDSLGNRKHTAFFPGIIRSRARLSYNRVHEAIPDAEHFHCNDPLLMRFPWLKDAAILANILLKKRLKRGSLDFDVPEIQFDIDHSEDDVRGACQRTRLFSHRIIEECMLAANEAAAEFLEQRNIPFLFRVHPAPDEERLLKLSDLLHNAGLKKRSLKRDISPKLLQDILHEAAGTPSEYIVSRFVLRSMMQARYDVSPGSHFGLASEAYCHFTSPIRRYADIVTHRAVYKALGDAIHMPGWKRLEHIADQCNQNERTAAEAEREISKRLGCLLLKKHIGETCRGVISSVMPFGFFTELGDPPLEGLVRLESLHDDWYDYDEKNFQLVGRRTGKIFRIGQEVTVRIADVNISLLDTLLEVTKDRRSPNFLSGKRCLQR